MTKVYGGRRVGLACLSWLAVLLSFVASSRADEPVLSFGVVPQTASTRLAEQWLPFLDEVGRRAGVRLVFRTAKDIPAFEAALAEGAYDFAYMNPYHYTVFHQKPGYEGVAHEVGRRLTGLIVVRGDSPYQRLEDLRGKPVIFPAPAAFAASILTQAEFARHGIAIAPKYVSSHDSVYLGVLSGHYAAGGGITRTLEALPGDQKAGLRVLSMTRDYTPHPVAVHPRIPAPLAARVVAAMQGLSADETGRRVLDGVAMKGIAAARDADWDDVRGLDISLLRHWLGQVVE
ncbi:hypothetical protein A6A04_09995 [Paramagnetospirillum marisnigri]|uniref:Phosphate ABC transporter substrate-binding protein n=1 Tax=Paramagnetospirillum marisnigri TaxID=1285242 RepID=A0A178M621_9PROT|nr:phosphate/phosphite/phosphonate ABC transporter substrate-binding protein [Paramagnetospirillum marisnigri]OAN43018.1 hypothetical protein A6A04_09995 [Paramagnetospirillum marisnigri]